MTARCIGVLAALSPNIVMEQVVTRVLPLLEAIQNDNYRQGAMEAIVCIIEKLQSNIIPFVVILLVPLLGKSPIYSSCTSEQFECFIRLSLNYFKA